jgi:hypothetical protein
MAILRMIPVVMLLAMCGCFAMHTTPIVQPAEMGPAEKGFQAVWDATNETLNTYRFTVNQRSRRYGRITTDPLGAKHFFEWWRRDKATATGALENSVQPIYRVVAVDIRKTGEGEYKPVVTITVSRLLAREDSGREAREVFNRKAKKDSDREANEVSDQEKYITLAIGRSEGAAKDSEKRSFGDDALARRIANDIKSLAHQKLEG